jgi:lipopolysaccharide/colanic/teichoic acid biosynthesis glycosyltransferase
LKTHSTLGVIITEVNAADSSIAHRLQQRIRRSLAQRISVDRLDAFSVLLSTYPDPQVDSAEGQWPIESLIGEVRPPGIRAKAYSALKRMLDLAASVVLLLILSPLWLLIAAAIKVSSRGPAFFKQVRVGEKGIPFEMIKFRTMEANADDRIHQAFVADLINAKTPATGFFKIQKDPRVTPIGRLLRKTSCDELPQLWNVFRGEMSLVGPRPPLSYEMKKYKAWHRRRILEAKPGMTGLWQVTGRSRTTFDEMVRLDLQYVRTRSLWTDVKILLATPAAVITGKGAC